MSEITPELQSELIEFVRGMAFSSERSDAHYYEAARLVDLLPPPVDPDIEEARKVTRGWRESPESPSAQDLALRAIKRGRELERTLPAPPSVPKTVEEG